MKEYDTSDVANIVGIANPTVNKYSLALEEAGHQFLRNKRGHRIYTDEDVQLLEKLKVQSNDTKMPVRHIANTLVSQQKHNIPEESEPVVHVITLKENEGNQPNSDDTLYSAQEFRQFFAQQFESLKEDLNRSFEEQLNKKLDEQREYFEEKLKWIERDREKNESLRRTMIETQKQHQQQIATALEEKKKSFFARLFGK